jgi:hypothetical protein
MTGVFLPLLLKVSVSENRSRIDETDEASDNHNQSDVEHDDDHFEETLTPSRGNTILSNKTHSYDDTISDSIDIFSKSVVSNKTQDATERPSLIKNLSNSEEYRLLEQLMNQPLDVRNEDIINVTSKQMNLALKIGSSQTNFAFVKNRRATSDALDDPARVDEANANFHKFCYYKDDSESILPDELKNVARKYHVQNKYNKNVCMILTQYSDLERRPLLSAPQMFLRKLQVLTCFFCL